LLYFFGLIPARLFSPEVSLSLGLPPGGWFSLVSSQFLHGGFLHLISNLWTLWIFGDNVEDRMGKFRFGVFYLLSGLAAGWLHALTHPGSTIPTIGASGAISGVLGAYLRWYPGARVLTLVPVFFYPLFFYVPALFYLGFWFLSQLFSGTMALLLPEGIGGVAWWAHIGGFLFGFVTCTAFTLPDWDRRPPRHWLYPLAPRTGSWRVGPPHSSW
jgi:membrane associated rhomboid family serine protease